MKDPHNILYFFPSHCEYKNGCYYNWHTNEYGVVTKRAIIGASTCIGKQFAIVGNFVYLKVVPFEDAAIDILEIVITYGEFVSYGYYTNLIYLSIIECYEEERVEYFRQIGISVDSSTPWLVRFTLC